MMGAVIFLIDFRGVLLRVFRATNYWRHMFGLLVRTMCPFFIQ